MIPAVVILGVLAVGLAVALTVSYRRQRDVIDFLTSQREIIDQEEHRMFAFLHSLGVALVKGESAARIHEIIVGGATDVMAARGGALYLADTKQTCLIPTFISRGCPPFVPLPDDVVAAAKKNSHALGS